MSGKLFALILIAAAVPASAQQGSSTGSDAAQSGTPQSNSSGQNANSKPASPNSTQSDPAQSTTPPSADGLSRDLTFPGDKPDASSSVPATPAPAKPKAANLTPPRSDRVQADDLGNGAGESSSKDTQIDLDAPADDAKAHPQSSAAVAEVAGGGITEFHTWDPHKAAKSVEVGDFYFKRKNYRAAEDRYREALRYKDNDAVATIRLAVSMEKLGELDDARAEYESYLRILPHGPQAGEAQKAVERLKGTRAQSSKTK
jgi:tetratricopeptide (TPR) repeat protein